MTFMDIVQLIIDNLAIPVLIAIGGAFAVFIGKWTDKVGNSITVKNEIESIEKRIRSRKLILDTLAPAVESAVASNMQLADTLRKNNNKLSTEDVKMLNESAKRLVLNTLPKSLTDDDGVLLDIIGGREQLETAIDVMIEQYVYEYKLKSGTKSTTKNNVYPIDPKFINIKK